MVHKNRTAIRVVFYGGLVVLIVGVLFEVFAEVLPSSIATRIGHNSEAYVLALILALWIEFVRPRLTDTAHERATVIVAAVGLLLVSAFLQVTDLPSRVATVHEAFTAAALLIAYVQLRRPLRRHLALWLSAGVLAIVVIGHRTEVVTDLAETLGVLLLAPIALDIVDRGILDPTAVTDEHQRWGWYAFLVAAPVMFSVLQYGLDLKGTGGEATRYAVRLAEAFLSVLAVELYFAVGLGRTGAKEQSKQHLSA